MSLEVFKKEYQLKKNLPLKKSDPVYSKVRSMLKELHEKFFLAQPRYQLHEDLRYVSDTDQVHYLLYHKVFPSYRTYATNLIFDYEHNPYSPLRNMQNSKITQLIDGTYEREWQVIEDFIVGELFKKIPKVNLKRASGFHDVLFEFNS